MQVKFNTNINQSRPNFKASFANTPETKKALKAIAKTHPYGVLEAVETLERIPDKDVFSVSQGNAYNKFNIINETLPKGSRRKSVEFDTNQYDLFIDKIARMPLSSGNYVNDYLPCSRYENNLHYNYDVDLRNGILAKLNKKSNVNFISEQVELIEKEREKIEDKIVTLRDKEISLRERENDLYQRYAEDLIDSL